MARAKRILRRGGGGALALDAVLALAVLSLAVAAPWRGAEAAPRLLAANATGGLALTNSSEGKAIFSGRDLRPGGSTAGTVSIGNPGSARLAVTLGATVSGDLAGTGGGRLSARVQLQVLDLTHGSVVYAGRLAALRSVALGTFAPRETRRYEFVATLPSLGAADDAYQGATLTTGFTWSATAVATATPTPTATPKPAPRVTAASVIRMPSAKRKLKRKSKTMTARFVPPAGHRVVSATTRVGRGKVHRYKAVKRVRISLRGQKGRRVKVTVSVRLDDGRRLTLRRTYRRR
ncbi:MAG TPA: hypothetical protein VH418_15190 [Solirubrobacteraceae bacterium]